MTPGSPNNSETPSTTTSGAAQQGVAVSVAVQSKPATFGTRTVYAQILKPRTPVPSSAPDLQESQPKRRKIAKTADEVASAKTVKAMQQYDYQEVMELNRSLIGHLTQLVLKNAQDVADAVKMTQTPPKPKPKPKPKPGAVADTTKNLLKQRFQTSVEKKTESSVTISQKKQERPGRALPQKQTVPAQTGFTYGPGDKEAKYQLQRYCENASYHVVRFCGVQIAPERFYQLFEVTPDRLLNLIKDKNIRKGNQFISPDVLRGMTPQQVQYLRDLAKSVYQFGLKYRNSRKPLMGYMHDAVHSLHAPPESNNEGLYDVLSYYAKELEARGLKCSTSQMLEFLREDADRTRMKLWLPKQAFKRPITEKEYNELFDLLEMADNHCRHYRIYKAASAKIRQKPITPARPVKAYSTPPMLLSQLLTRSAGQPFVPVDNVSAKRVDDTSVQKQSDDKQPVPEELVSDAEALSLAPEPETEHEPSFPDLTPVYLTDIPVSRKYPGIPNNGNYCYMICAVQFLRATMPEKQQLAMIAGWRQKLKVNPEVLPETVADGFSALLSTMSESKESRFSKADYRRHMKQIGVVFRQFAVLCLQHESLCTEVKGGGRYQKDTAYIQSLEQNDAQGFLMKLQYELELDHQKLLSELKQDKQKLKQIRQQSLNFFEQLNLNLDGQSFFKPQTDSGISNVLMLSLVPDGDIQKSLDTFLESDLKCRWNPEELTGGRNLPEQGEDGYPTRLVIEIKTDPSRLERFTLCLKNTEIKNIGGQFKDRKITTACEGSIDQVFNEISLPVTDPETGNKHRLIARPRFIICHNGHDYQSGHYLSLQLQDTGWVLNDDDYPARLLPEPDGFLRKKKAYPYLVEYRVVGSEPV